MKKVLYSKANKGDLFWGVETLEKYYKVVSGKKESRKKLKSLTFSIRMKNKDSFYQH